MLQNIKTQRTSNKKKIILLIELSVVMDSNEKSFAAVKSFNLLEIKRVFSPPLIQCHIATAWKLLQIYLLAIFKEYNSLLAVTMFSKQRNLIFLKLLFCKILFLKKICKLLVFLDDIQRGLDSFP